MLPAGQAGMFTVLNQIRGGKRVRDVIWMETTVAWLHSLTQLGGKESLQFIKRRRSCAVFVSGYFRPFGFRRSYETCWGVLALIHISPPLCLLSSLLGVVLVGGEQKTRPPGLRFKVASTGLVLCVC